MKFVAIAAAATLALGSAAYAGGHSNKDEARAMSSALQTLGGGNNSAIKDALNITDNGGVARFVSGKGNGGWGNLGSQLTNPETGASNPLATEDGLNLDGVSVSGR